MTSKPCLLWRASGAGSAYLSIFIRFHVGDVRTTNLVNVMDWEDEVEHYVEVVNEVVGCDDVILSGSSRRPKPKPLSIVSAYSSLALVQYMRYMAPDQKTYSYRGGLRIF